MQSMQSMQSPRRIDCATTYNGGAIPKTVNLACILLGRCAIVSFRLGMWPPPQPRRGPADSVRHATTRDRTTIDKQVLTCRWPDYCIPRTVVAFDATRRRGWKLSGMIACRP